MAIFEQLNFQLIAGNCCMFSTSAYGDLHPVPLGTLQINVSLSYDDYYDENNQTRNSGQTILKGTSTNV